MYSLLFGFQWLVCKKWSKYYTSNIKVNMNSSTLEVKGQLAITITFNDLEPTIKYEDGWEEWLSSTEWDDLMADALDRLARANISL